MKKIIAAFLLFFLVATLGIPVSAAGYIVITEPQYNMAEAIDGTITKVSKNSKWALANQDGVAFTGYNWDTLGSVNAEYIPAKKDGKWGFISKKGTVLIPYQYASVSCFKDGFAVVQQADGEYIFIDVRGKKLFTSPFTYTFSASEGAICGTLDNFYGYCDTEGNIIILPQFDMAYDFHEGHAAVKTEGKWGYINSYGDYVIRPVYDYAGDFKDGYAICRLGQKYGIINTDGTRIAPFTFDYIGPCDDQGRYPAKSGDISGYIDASGKWLLKTSYAFCYPYTDGVARVFQDEKWGFIDEDGNELIAPIFTDCGEYCNGRAPYSLDGILWGYMTIDFEAQPEKTTLPTTNPADDREFPSGATDDNLPLAPDGNNCISLKIDSTIALHGDDTFSLSAAPVLLNGTTMIPVRDVVELLGGLITWEAESQRIVINKDKKSVSLRIGSNIALTAEGSLTLPQAPMLINGSTMVPLRTVTDSLGCPVTWIDTYRNIYIYDK